MAYDELDSSIPVIEQGKVLPDWFLEKQLDLLRDEREYRAANDTERRRYQRYYDGIPPDDDPFADDEYLRDIRLNMVSPHINLVIGEMGKRQFYPRLFPYAGDEKGDFWALIQLRDMQSRALFTASEFHRHRTTAIRDALTSGDGWIRYGLRRKGDNGIELFAEHTPWDEILYDSYRAKANGDIQGCRWIAHYTLMELGEFGLKFRAFKKRAEEMCRTRPSYNSSPVDSAYGEGEGYFPLQNSQVWGGEGETQKYVVYGVMFFRHPTSDKLFKYPFLTDRGLTELVALDMPKQPYSHHLYPFLRWVSAQYSQHRGLPYSPLRHKVGLERFNQILIRGATSSTGGQSFEIEEGAQPMGEDGENLMPLDEFRRYLAEESQHTHKFYVFGERALRDGKVRVTNGNAQAGELMKILEMTQAFEARSGGAPNPALTGGGGTSPHSGASLREHLDNTLAQHRMLIETDRDAVRTVGRMNLYFIDDYADELPLLSFMDEDGEQRFILNELSDGDRAEAEKAQLAAKDFGVGVRAQERKPDVMQEVLPFALEVTKSFAGDKNKQISAVLAITNMKQMQWSSAAIDFAIEGMLHDGVIFPKHLLSPRLRKEQEKIKQQRDKDAAEQNALAKRAGVAEIDKTESEADKNRAQETGAKAKAVKDLADAEKGDGEGEGGGDLDAAMRRVADLERQLAAERAARNNGGAAV